MNLPTVITNLVTAQNNFDSLAYSNCFSQNAVVFDEGHTHTGRKEIEHWIADANERYKATMKPVSFDETESLLKAEVSGDFPGSPLVLSYQLDIRNGEIQSLKIV
ncbi:MAG: nuclear transport factor 2 family protein [Fluviicola sp.]